VQETREREARGYQGGATRLGKLQQLPKDIPQSVSIVSEQLIHDRNADTLREALRNVAGLTFNAGEGGRIGDNVTLRGYSAVGDLYLDGMRDVAQYNREVFNVEQVEVLRGSASMLFGRGSTGGVINQVSKKPHLSDQHEIDVTVGSHRYRRITADLNQVLGANAAVRVNAMKTETDSFRHGVKQSREGAAPALRIGVGTRDEFSIAAFYLRDDNVPDYGVPYFRGRPLAVPVERYYGMANADFDRNETGIGTLAYTHRYGPATELRTALRYANYNRDLWAVAPRLGTINAQTGACTVNNNLAAVNDATAVCRQRQARGGEENTLTSQTDFTTRFAAFGWQHVWLTGLEVQKESARRWSNVGPVANPPTTVGNPDPYPPVPANYYDSARVPQAAYDAYSAGLYAQDIVQFAPRFKALAGVRYDVLDADYRRVAPLGDLARTDRVFSWRTGLMFEPYEDATYYLAFGTSFNPSAELYQLDNRTANTPPEKSRNVELGAKWDLADGNLSLRTSLSRSQKTHERNTDLAQTSVSVLSGKRHTDALEIEAAGRVTPAWDVFVALTGMLAQIDQASGQQANTQGKRPVNTPTYTASLWTTYRLAPRWRVGGGVEAVGNRYANATNGNLVPHYARVDALAEYDTPRYGVKLNVLNLFDAAYYEGVYAGHTVPGTRRAVQLLAKLKF
jgi:catecholate siderophore receptor